MAILDHWHPVLFSRELGSKPVGVNVAGHEIALFRTSEGTAALDDVCPHRRMRLSLGDIVADKLQCKYHGWTFARDGQGESPGTPKLFACATSYDVREAHGAVWVKNRDATPQFPNFDVNGYRQFCTMRYVADVPLELVTDNFCEIEHTAMVHAIFGYDLARMDEVTMAFEQTDSAVRATSAGPHRSLNPILKLALGIRRGFHFADDWTTYFSPVYSVFDHRWFDPSGEGESKIKWRVYVFYTPLSDTKTELRLFGYAKSAWPGPAGGLRLAGWLMRRNMRREIELDLNLLSGLADLSPDLQGMKLSRFDKCLALNRERIDRIYRGKNPDGS